MEERAAEILDADIALVGKKRRSKSPQESKANVKQELDAYKLSHEGEAA